MEEAARARRAAREAVADVEPNRLREAVDALLVESSMTPGVLVLLAAGVTDEAADPGAVDERTAGVQLIYEGLRLTRHLAREEPWLTATDHTSANIDVLIADVLVSRGFYLLAHTEAADKAVDTVRAFGRDQTRRREPDADAVSLDRTLETNVFELAGMAGSTVSGSCPDPTLLARFADLAATVDAPGLPDASTFLQADPTFRHTITDGDEHVSTPATDS